MATDTRMLAVTGDDFGLTPGVNAGILEAHLHGVLTHASLMASAPRAREAIALARQTPSLSVGVHLVLVDGRPVLPPRLVPTLIGRDGAFRPGPIDLVRDWVLGRVSPVEVERELRAQIAVLADSPLLPTHVDSHKHVHMWPPLFAMVMTLARQAGIPQVRLALERPAWQLVTENAADAGARAQAVANALMLPFGWMAAREMARNRLRPRWFIGRVHTGILTPERLARALRRVPPGVAELMTHPGRCPDPDLDLVRTRLRSERASDLALLCAPGTRDLLRENGIELAGVAPAGRSASLRRGIGRLEECPGGM